MRIIQRILIFFTWIVVISLSAFTSTYAQTEKPTLTIGLLLSLTGGLEQYGIPMQKGSSLALEDKSSVNVKLIIEDDRSIDRKAVVSAVQKLIEVDKVDVLINWTASSSPPVIPIVTHKKVPLVIGAYDRNVRAAGEWVFGSFVNYEVLAREHAHFLVNTLGFKRIAVIAATDDWSKQFAEPFAIESEKLGATLVLNEEVSPDTTDLRSIILRAQKSDAQAIFAPLFGNSLYALARQTKALNYPVIIDGADGIFEADIKELGPAAEGIYASQIWNEDEALSKQVEAKFKIKPTGSELGLYATAIDIIRHLRGAAEGIIKANNKITRDSMLKALRTHESQGLLGPIFLGLPPKSGGERMLKVVNGKFTPLTLKQ